MRVEGRRIVVVVILVGSGNSSGSSGTHYGGIRYAHCSIRGIGALRLGLDLRLLLELGLLMGFSYQYVSVLMVVMMSVWVVR